VTFGAGGQRSNPLSYGRLAELRSARESAFGKLLFHPASSLEFAGDELAAWSSASRILTGKTVALWRRGRDSNPRRSVNPSTV
jgi:hypothetical protein